MWGVMRFYNLLRIGVTWKGPEIIELWYNPSDSSKGSISQRFDYRIDDDNDDDDDRDVHTTDDAEKSAASGSDEDDSLLVAYDSNSIGSVWPNIHSNTSTVCNSGNVTIALVLTIGLIECYAQYKIFWI